MTPPKLASWSHSLPPILYMQCRNPISSCSKAPRGLSVLLRVTGIFTGTTISPSLLLRQCPDRYAPYTSAFALAETCVFGKQSPGPFHCGHLSMAPLLPKLRGHFAEFLNNSSLAHLRILSSSTCVGLRYGHLRSH